MVYFLQAKTVGLVKIGHTSGTRRIDDLRSMNADELELMLMLTGGMPMEQTLHGLFRIYRHHGEWFRPRGLLLDFLGDAVGLAARRKVDRLSHADGSGLVDEYKLKAWKLFELVQASECLKPAVRRRVLESVSSDLSASPKRL